MFRFEAEVVSNSFRFDVLTDIHKRSVIKCDINHWGKREVNEAKTEVNLR